MPRRNLTILLTAAIVSLACYTVATRNRYVTTITKAMNIVSTEYIDEVEPRVLFEGAMEGMLGRLDPYSGYVSPDEFQQFQQTMDGELEGVGIVIEPSEEGPLKVVDALIGKPAYVAGIRAGDTILAIDDRELKDLPLGDAVSMIRGRPGTTVKVRVRHARGGEPMEYNLLRAKIPLESVLGDARRADGTWVFRFVEQPRIGFIRIVSFGERTGTEMRQALGSYRQPGEEIDGLVIDLRGNAGGLLKAAVETCDLFLDRGLIVSTQGRGRVERNREIASSRTEFPAELPIVILVDKLSASASEIVAACLQDHERATIAGQRSWGKGTVQNVIYLPVDGQQSALRLTAGSYLRPSGEEIHKRQDAKEDDPWGVRPSPELEVHPTNQQYETFMRARRKRDLLSWEELASARKERGVESTTESGPPSAAYPQDTGRAPRAPLDDGFDPAESDAPGSGIVVPAIPVPPAPIPDPEESAPEETAESNAWKDPAEIDPQLHKAVEHLQQQIARKKTKPRRG